MQIGGIQKVSLVDYPGRISTVIFVKGCNFRCIYCHNPEFVLPHLFPPTIPIEEVLEFLKRRKKFLDGVVISGGEPFFQKELKSFLKEVKKMGYLVKIDTNGSFPDRLEEVIKENLVDYIAMDIKAPFEKYSLITRVNVNIPELKRSIKIIRNSGKEYEFRTTVLKRFLKFEDIVKILECIDKDRNYRIQRFRFSPKIRENFLKNLEYRESEIDEFKKKINEILL